MRRAIVIEAALVLGCTTPSPRPTHGVAAPPTAICGTAAPAAIPSIASSSPPAAPEEPPPCEPRLPADAANVAIAWNPCPDISQWFVTRGFPAVSEDGRLVALAERQDFAAKSSTNLRITVRQVDGGEQTTSVKVLDPFEFDEPDLPPGDHRATITARIAKANELVRALIPMDADPCAGPQPWPSEAYGGYEGCTAPTPPAQSIVCSTKAGAPSTHVLTVGMKPRRLYADVDATKPLVIDRDIAAWTEAWDPNFTPGGQGKKTATMPPHLESAFVDFGRRVLVIRTAYCNTADSQPKFPDAWHVFRLPKLAEVK